MTTEHQLGNDVRARALLRRAGETVSEYPSGQSGLGSAAESDLAARLLDILPVPVGYLDTDLVVRVCGRAAARAIGRAQDEIVGRDVREVFGADNEAVAALRGVIASRTPTALLMSPPVSDDQADQHWEVSFVPDMVGGTLMGVMAVGFDVTDLVATQRRMAESEYLYRSIGELIPYGTWTADGDGAMTYVSDSFAVMAGVEREQLLGWGWLDLLPSDSDRKEALAAWHHSRSHEGLRDTKHVIRASDGSFRHILCRGIRIGPTSGGKVEWAGIHIDVTETERQLRFREALAVVKDTLVTSLDTETLLGRVSDAMLSPSSADYAAVIIPVDSGWEVRYSAGENKAFRGATRVSREEMPLAVLAYETGAVQVASDAPTDERMNAAKAHVDALRSLAILPIKRDGTPICLLALAYTTSAIVADKPLLDFFSDLISSLDLALQAATVHEHERHIAETLQEGLLAVPEHLPCVEIAHLYRAAAEEARVGGDFYDAFEMHGCIAFLVGDVSGSGLEAAALTALAKNTIRAHLIDGQSPGDALTKTNLVMYGFTEAHEFATVFVGVYDPDTGRLQFASAGHPPPLAVGQNGVRKLEGGGLLLGALDDSRFEDFTCDLGDDDTILLYTDGIIEARQGPQLYGEDRLVALLASGTGRGPSALLSLVLDDVRLFASGVLDDDVAMLAITPAREPHASGPVEHRG